MWTKTEKTDAVIAPQKSILQRMICGFGLYEVAHVDDIRGNYSKRESSQLLGAFGFLRHFHWHVDVAPSNHLLFCRGLPQHH